MKYTTRTVNSIVYVGGIFAIVSAAVAIVLFLMSSLGMIFPRKVSIVISSPSVSKVYDAQPISGGELFISEGELHPGHTLKTIDELEYSSVGEYENSPAYAIVDSTGSDVTKMYKIYHSFGRMIIYARDISVYSPDKQKQYDSRALESDSIKLVGGTLCEGHSFIADGYSSITYPGEMQIGSHYRIEDEDGIDVTSQYNVDEQLGTLRVMKRSLSFRTNNASKYYDGTPLVASGWTHLSGSVLDGHTVSASTSGAISDVGVCENTLDVWVRDSEGNDITHLYEITVALGTLEVMPCPLYIKTGSETRVYDGQSLVCESWEIVEGKISDGERLCVVTAKSISFVGTAENEILFAVKDKDGADISYRYDIRTVTGTLVITPRPIAIRTESAQKVYDGTPLVCEEYEMIAGSLCDGEYLQLVFSSHVNIGYSQNYIISYSILRENADKSISDVTANYRISYSFGTLTVTAK